MRKILFKAKLKDWKTNPQHNKWMKGYYLSRKETTYCFTEDYERNPVKALHYIAVDSMTDWGLPNEFRLYEIDPDTLCQFTGLTDKNGDNIWENDIVKDDKIYMIGTIEWYEQHGTYVVNDINDGYQNFEEFWSCTETVGNIFDNPELIKSEF